MSVVFMRDKFINDSTTEKTKAYTHAAWKRPVQRRLHTVDIKVCVHDHTINLIRCVMKQEVVGRGARDVTSAIVMTPNTTTAAVVCVLVQYQSVCSVAGT